MKRLFREGPDRINIRFLASYTIIWLFMIVQLIIIFRTNGKIIINRIDGIAQHYVAFNHVCDYVKGFFQNGFTGMPMFNMHLGLGADAISTLNCYDLMDPISIFAAYLTPISRIHRFEFMEISKLFLSGIYLFCNSSKLYVLVVFGTFDAGRYRIISQKENPGIIYRRGLCQYNNKLLYFLCCVMCFGHIYFCTEYFFHSRNEG